MCGEKLKDGEHLFHKKIWKLLKRNLLGYDVKLERSLLYKLMIDGGTIELHEMREGASSSKSHNKTQTGRSESMVQNGK